LIDGITYGPQVTGVSQGRFLDGGAAGFSFPGTASPGAANYLLLTNVVINEVLSHSDDPLEDAIELFNPTAQPVNISGWWLSDDKSTLQKYQIPFPTILPANGFTVIYEAHFTNRVEAAIPFALSSHGDEVVLSAATNNTLTGYRTGVKFGAADNAVSFGRYLTSDGREEFVPMSAHTFGMDDPSSVQQFRTGTGATNAYPEVGPVIISEIMYHPPDDGLNDNVADEFIELRNITTAPVPLYDPAFPTNVWHLRNAVDFNFPTGTVLQAGATLLVVSFDPVNNPGAVNAFRSYYNLATEVPMVGPYTGKLANDNDQIELRKPGTPDTNGVDYILVEQIKYFDNSPWPALADGTGLSLQRVSDTGFGNDPTNWVAATPTPGPQALALDSDGDGIPDWWETLYGLDPHNRLDGNLDSDGDGRNNLQEYLSGTDPRNAQSVLRLESLGLAPGGTNMLMTFTAVSNHTYTVQWKESSGVGAWTKLADTNGGADTHLVQIVDPLPLARGRVYQLLTPQLPGPANPQPAVLGSPQSASTEVGGDVSFDVVAVGNGPLSYQWSYNGNIIPNVAGPILTLTNVQFSDIGLYSVVVSDANSSAASGQARLSLPPRLLSEPSSQTAQPGDTVTFTAAGEGLAPLGYRWRHNGHFIVGQTNATLVLNNVQNVDGGKYSVSVFHHLPWGYWSRASSNAVLTIGP
jgi:hypothetical protein